MVLLFLSRSAAQGLSQHDLKLVQASLKTLNTLALPLHRLPTAKRDGCGWGAERTNKRSYRVYRSGGFRMIGRLCEVDGGLLMVIEAVFSDGEHKRYRAYLEKHLNGNTKRRSTRKSKAAAKQTPVEPEVCCMLEKPSDVVQFF